MVGVDLNRNYGVDWNLTSGENKNKDIEAGERAKLGFIALD